MRRLPVLLKIGARQAGDSGAERLAEFDPELRDYRYTEDPDGLKCPLGAHIRRANPRDMLDPELSKIGEASTR